MKKLIPFILIALLLCSCTTMHITENLTMIDSQTSNSAIRVNVVANTVRDSYACFLVSIDNNSRNGIYFYEDQISFWSGNQPYNQMSFLSRWNSETYVNQVIEDSASRFAVAAFFVDLFSVDDDYYYEEDNSSDFFEFLSIINLIATGIDSVSTIEQSQASLLKSVYIPAGETAYGFVCCKLPTFGSSYVKVVVDTNRSLNTFTFSRH